MSNVPETFGSMVFNDRVMQERLPKETYKALKKTMRERQEPGQIRGQRRGQRHEGLGRGKGRHPLYPLVPAHDRHHRRKARQLHLPPRATARVIMEFSGKELIKGEPDASTFPSGGLRATFEARGYTAWDPTAYAFIKDDTLCIPTAFCSYGGEALDKKTPLLRSMEAINKQAMRILKLFGNDGRHPGHHHRGPGAGILPDRQGAVRPARGPDLSPAAPCSAPSRPRARSWRTTTSAPSSPGSPAYMQDLDEELWKLGILAKTEHNEVAPAQHELAPIFTTTNIATDHNQLTMEIMKKVAERHGLCLPAP